MADESPKWAIQINSDRWENGRLFEQSCPYVRQLVVYLNPSWPPTFDGYLISSTFKLSPTLECWHHVVNRTVYTDKINVPSCILRNWICSILIIDTNTNRDLFTGSTVVARIDQILLEPITNGPLVKVLSGRSWFKINGQNCLKWTDINETGHVRFMKVDGLENEMDGLLTTLYVGLDL